MAIARMAPRTPFWLVFLFVSCSDPESNAPPTPGAANARWEIVEALRSDLEAARNPGDGGGSVALIGDGADSRTVTAGGRGTWRFQQIFVKAEYRADVLRRQAPQTACDDNLFDFFIVFGLVPIHSEIRIIDVFGDLGQYT